MYAGALTILAIGFALWLILGGPAGFITKWINNRHELRMRRETQKDKELEIESMKAQAALADAKRNQDLPWTVDVSDPAQIAAYREVQLSAARATLKDSGK